ncbi:SUMF1/EgtB/PvdO family nonheme iron enzyme [Verrucomicrobiaceae bacterium N1E253]|uniref:SUMF1/EgtB/PvdO family nonheme iron enzyme n=1 Tax=Oceaniferula marina TaxID=2748318 RepID=A0A851GHM3_9BACT|nr:SUMF1/EgtB/PvdO family nonheme iron enzyme [Oceaniferula marina]NWK56856.1 SUMF1/EgtB/PvdO family nonheme iron enzyme [Oceaniferula marina]
MVTDPANAFAPGKQLEDYLLSELLFQGSHTLTWTATQVSVQREVIISSLLESLEHDEETVAAFFADVRAKASVEHPLIGSVLEAVRSDGHCFYAREKLLGASLEQHHQDGLGVSPLHMARIIRGLADAYRHLEVNGVATLPLTPNDLFLDERFHCRMVNMVVDGVVDPQVFTRDKQLLGMLFHDLLEPNQPGSTRMGSLLDFMADLEREHPLSWEQIYDLADEVERQLAEPKNLETLQSRTIPMKPLVSMAAMVKIGIAVTALSIVVGLGYYISTRPERPTERELKDLVRIPAGTYPGPDGMPVKSRAFWMDAHEVTIGEYAKFLKALEVLSDDQKHVYRHEDQPAEKESHMPDDWELLYATAKAGGTWNALKVDLNYPVVGVDWWDAYAYSEWRGRRLPTREEWYVSGSAGGDMGKLQGTGWLPVDETECNELGICGLAGNVSEWTRKRSLNPADPSQPARYVICGASYLKPKFGARAREWVDDRSLRRSDLGFRTLSQSAQDD